MMTHLSCAVLLVLTRPAAGLPLPGRLGPAEVPGAVAGPRERSRSGWPEPRFPELGKPLPVLHSIMIRLPHSCVAILLLLRPAAGLPVLQPSFLELGALGRPHRAQESYVGSWVEAVTSVAALAVTAASAKQHATSHLKRGSSDSLPDSIGSVDPAAQGRSAEPRIPSTAAAA